MDPRIRNSCTVAYKGSTMTGKTTHLFKLLANRMNPHVFTRPELNQRVLYCYGSYQPKFDEVKERDPHITFHRGLPEKDFKHYLPEGGIVVLDDVMNDAVNDPRVSDLFTKGAHHDNITPITLEQNMFPQGRGGRTQRLNTQYLFLFKNPTDHLGPRIFARQAFPKDRQENFFRAFEEATQRPYGYLMLDMHPLTSDAHRLRTDVIPDEPGARPNFVYWIDERDTSLDGDSSEE